jgi:hypothetical protein
MLNGRAWGPVWDHTFSEVLGVDPANARILLTEPPQNPLANRERLLETMFERYGFAGAPGCRPRAPPCQAHPEQGWGRIARRRLCADPGGADALRTRCALKHFPC